MDDSILLLSIAIIGIAIGYLAGSLLSGGRDGQENQDAPQTVQPQFPADALHMWRDSQTKQIVLQIGKRIYISGEALPPTEGKYLAGLIAYLQRWLGIPATTSASQASPQAIQPSQSPESALPNISPFVGEVPDTPEVPFEEKSIVGQIDEILQEKILNTPLRDKGIRLIENIDGSMRVYVGLEQFDDVDSIPDETIKAAIRAAVHNWEQRQ